MQRKLYIILVFLSCYFSSSLYYSGNAGDEEQNASLILHRLEDGKFNYVTYREEVYLLKEENRQKVFLNYKRNHEISQLLQEALEYGKSSKNALAIEKLEEVLAKDPDNAIAKQYMDILSKEQK